MLFKEETKTRLNEKVLTRLKSKVEELSKGFLSLEETEENAGKFIYYLSELQKVGSEWNEVVHWPDENYMRLAREYSNGFPKYHDGVKVTGGLNCPYCGLTPLDNNCPITVTKLSDYYCHTCKRFVVFAERHYQEFRTKLRVTDDMIVVLKR